MGGRSPTSLRRVPTRFSQFVEGTTSEEMAGGPGIEPGFLEPKSNVLPLDDPPTEVPL